MLFQIEVDSNDWLKTRERCKSKIMLAINILQNIEMNIFKSFSLSMI